MRYFGWWKVRRAHRGRRQRTAGREAVPGRVLLLVENLPLARDHRLRKQVASLAGAGYDVTVICPADPANAQFEHVRVLGYPTAPQGPSTASFVVEYAWAWMCTTGLFVWVWLTRGFDVLQVAGNPDIFFMLSGPARRRGRAVVFDQRDLAPETYLARYGRRGRLYRLLLWLERRSYRSVDHVLVVNETLRKIAVQRGGIAPGAITVVGNGPRLAAVGTARQDSLDDEDTALKHGSRMLVVVWVGVMGPQDHVDLALRAFAELRFGLHRPDCHLTLIGDGDSRPDAESLAEELGIRPNVTFTGWLNQTAIFAQLATADIGVDSNLDDFVSPVKVMEYMAFAVPVVAFDLPETRTLTAGAALLAAPGDVGSLAVGMERLCGNNTLRAELGARGREQVEQRVAWDRQEENYLRVFRELVAGEPSAS